MSEKDARTEQMKKILSQDGIGRGELIEAMRQSREMIKGMKPRTRRAVVDLIDNWDSY